MNKWKILCLLMCVCTFVKGQDIRLSAQLLYRPLSKDLPDTTRIKLQLAKARYYLYQRVRFSGYLDSAKIWYKLSADLSERINSVVLANQCLEFRGLYEYETGSPEKGKAFFAQVIKNRQLKNERKSAQAWADIAGNIPVWTPRSCEARAMCFEQSKIISHHLGDTLKEVLALKEEADAHLNQGEFHLAETELLQVVQQLKALHYRKLYDSYYLLGALYRLMGDLHKELFYCLETVKSMEATGDTSSEILFYGKLGVVYEELQTDDKSIFYLNKALIAARGNLFYKCNILEHIVRILIRDHKKDQALAFFKKNFTPSAQSDPVFDFNQFKALANCYIALGLYDPAEKYIKKMITSAGRVDVSWAGYGGGLINAYSLACEFYLLKGDYRNAELYLRKISAQKVLNGPISSIQVQLYQFKIDSAAGNYLSAIKHYQLHKKLSDSLYNAAKSKQIEELQISYETSQKEKDIQLLKKQSQIQKVGLEKKSAIANLMIFSLALALVLLGVLFNRYKLNRRNNLVMQETQKEITAKNSWLEKLLQEKDWLLREVHHRVKNNLQIVMSLLQSQSVYLKDEVALIAIVESQHRVQAMSLIHQKLYKSGNLSTVYMPEYIYDLVEYLQDCFKTKNAVYFELKIEQIKLDVTKAVPVGLILNEIITNALKHAFPHTLDDKILVELYSSANDIISLVITDNGCGFPCDFDVDISKSFGMILMKGLTEDLDGTFTISSQSGIKTTITFSNLPLYFDKIGHVNPGES